MERNFAKKAISLFLVLIMMFQINLPTIFADEAPLPGNVVVLGEELSGGIAKISRIERPVAQTTVIDGKTYPSSYYDSVYIGGTGLTQKLPEAVADFAPPTSQYIAAVDPAVTAATMATNHHRDKTSMAHNSSAVLNTSFTKETAFDYTNYTNTTRAFKIEAIEGWYGEPEKIPDLSKAYLLAVNLSAETSLPNDYWWNVLKNAAYLTDEEGEPVNSELSAKLAELGYTGYWGPKEGKNLAAGTFEDSTLYFISEEPGVFKITFAIVDSKAGAIAESTVEISVLPRESRYKSKGNPLFPMWQHIPDTVPFVAEDPDNPGEYRLYWTGSHDTTWRNSYCGQDQVMWSAPIDDLTDWTYHGVIFENVYNRDGEPRNANKSGYTLYAPDMTIVKDTNGKATYYFYPFPTSGGAIVTKSDRPDGPFTGNVINWSPTNANQTVGVIGSDPGVFWDPETGRIFQYQGIGSSTVDELEPDMYSRKAGTQRQNLLAAVDADESDLDPQHFRYYEAPKMSKIWFYKDTGKPIPFGKEEPGNPNHVAKYVLVYCRRAKIPEKHPWAANQKAFAYADDPLGPFTFGGVIIDASGEITEDGTTGFQMHNTHGALFQVKDQWYISYHRSTGTGWDARQSAVEAVYPSYDPTTGAVIIPEVEMTSMGFNILGLNPYERYSAGFACYYTNGSYIRPDHSILPDRSGSASQRDDMTPVVNVKNGAAVGFKFFKFGGANAPSEGYHTELEVEIVPQNVDGFIDVYVENVGRQFRPNEPANGREIIGTIPISRSLTKDTPVKLTVPVPEVDNIIGKKGLFFVFRSPDTESVICEFNGFEFKQVADPEAGTPVGIDIAMGSFDRFSLMQGETVPLTINAIFADGSKTDVTASAIVDVTGGTFESGNITTGSVGSGLITATYDGITKTIPFKVTEFLPRAGIIKVDGKWIDNFSKDKFSYSFSNFSSVPEVTVILPSSRLTYTITPATEIPGTTEVIVKDAADPENNSAIYKIHFRNSPDSDYFFDGDMSDSWKIVNDNSNWRLEKGKGLVLPSSTVGVFPNTVPGSGQPPTSNPSSNVDIKNMFILPAAGDWRIIAKIHVPTISGNNNNYQIGVYAWEDEDNYVINRGTVQGNTLNIRKGVMLNGTHRINRNTASASLSSDRVIYLGLEKCDNYYTALHSVDGINFPGSDGRFGPYVTMNTNEPQFAVGPVLRDVHFGIMASKANSSLPDVEFYVEYIAVLTADGQRIMYNEDMLQSSVDNFLESVTNEVPARIASNLEIPRVPDGYTLTVKSSKPEIISDTGVINPTFVDESVILTFTVTHRGKTATKDVSVIVEKAETTEPLAILSADDVVQPDSTFTVTVNLDNIDKGVFAEDITLSYDANVFEYVSAQGANEHIHIVREAPGNGTIRIIAANVGGVTGESTPVLNLRFKVKSGVQGVSGSIAITKAELGVAPEGSIITPHLTSKSIQVTVIADKTALVAAIADAQTLYDNAVVGTEPGQYPAAAKEAFLLAINAANAVLADTTVTQAGVDQAVIVLNEAVNTFKASVIKEPEVDKSALGALISAVQAIYDTAVEGMENGQYPAAVKAALLSAINAAKAVYEDNDATQSEVDNARNALQEAKDIFEASIITESTADLNKDGIIDIGDLAIAAFYYGKTSESEDWNDAKAADVNCDGTIGIEDLAFIALRIIS